MKKMQLNTAKLQLNKNKITSLTNAQMNAVHGGDDNGGGDQGGTDIHFLSINCSNDKSCHAICQVKCPPGQPL